MFQAGYYLSTSACTHACRINLRFDFNSDTSIDLIIVTSDLLTIANLLIAYWHAVALTGSIDLIAVILRQPDLKTPSSTRRL